MDVTGILLAIFQKIDANLQQMEARFDEIQQTMRSSQSQPLMQIPDVNATEKEFQAPVECLQDNSENLVKMADIVIAQDPELEPLANPRNQDREVLEAPPTKLNWEINSEARDLSFSNKFEFGGNNPSLNLELPVFGDLIWARQCEKYSRNCGIADARHLFEKMPVREFICSDYSVQVGSGQPQLGNWVFDPGAKIVDGFSSKDHGLTQKTNLPKFDPRNETPNCKNSGYFRELQGNFESFYAVTCDGLSKQVITSCEKDQLEESCDSMIFLGPDSEMLVELLCGLNDCFGSIDSFTFDPGGRIEFPLLTLDSLVIMVFDPGILHELELQVVLIGGYWILVGLMILVFDPGIVSKGDDRSAQLNIGCILEQFQVHYQQELRFW